jgi:hypothetical protein
MSELLDELTLIILVLTSADLCLVVRWRNEVKTKGDAACALFCIAMIDAALTLIGCVACYVAVGESATILALQVWATSESAFLFHEVFTISVFLLFNLVLCFYSFVMWIGEEDA